MAGEISAAGAKIYYAPETTAGVCPSSGFAEKASGTTQNIADYVTSVSGLGADYDMQDVTTLSSTKRRRFLKGLQSNDGSISMNANINPISRTDWNSIVAEHAALTDGKSMWFQFILPGDDLGYFVRGEPLLMHFPDIEAGQAVQGAIQIVENDSIEWSTKITGL